MKILVTGGTGFIGQRIVRMLLGRGHEVHVVGRFAKAVEKDVQFHRVNLAREIIPSKVSDGVDAVFHVAAKTLSTFKHFTII